jgi:hypothetical protein
MTMWPLYVLTLVFIFAAAWCMAQADKKAGE